MTTKLFTTIKDMYETSYMSIPEIASSLGISRQYCHKVLNQGGYRVAKLPKHGFADVRCRDKEQFKALVKDCYTVQELADKLEIPFGSARLWMEHHSVSMSSLKPYRASVHHAWKGGTFMHKGRRYISCDIAKDYKEFNPDFNPGRRYVMEHRLQAEMSLLDQPIPDGFVVHHLDEDVDNNEVENLTILTRSQHGYIHQNMARARALKDEDTSREKYLIKKLKVLAIQWGSANIEVLQLSKLLKNELAAPLSDKKELVNTKEAN